MKKTLLALLTLSTMLSTACAAEANTRDLDTSAIEGLNKDAAKVWQLMVDCSEDHTPSSVRHSYLNNQWDCPRAQAKNLRAQMRNFKSSVEAFLKSTSVAQSEIDDIPGSYNSTGPELHLLLVQAIIESIADNGRYVFLDNEFSTHKRFNVTETMEVFFNRNWMVLRIGVQDQCGDWGMDPLLTMSLLRAWQLSQPIYAYSNGRDFMGGRHSYLVEEKLASKCGSLRQTMGIARYLDFRPDMAALRKISKHYR